MAQQKETLENEFNSWRGELEQIDDVCVIGVENSLTHLDFLIYNKLSKYPILGIEVDGFKYHKEGTKQAERDKIKDKILDKYNLPLLRFKTNESNEEERLKNKLNQLQ